MTPTPQRLAELAKQGMVVKPFMVTVRGYSEGAPYYVRSRGKALASAWQCDAFSGLSFGEFLKIARAKMGEPHDRFGEAITVGGKPAFLVSYNRQYIQFVRPGCDVVMTKLRRGDEQPSL